jgi:hypothetical protein
MAGKVRVLISYKMKKEGHTLKVFSYLEELSGKYKLKSYVVLDSFLETLFQ